MTPEEHKRIVNDIKAIQAKGMAENKKLIKENKRLRQVLAKIRADIIMGKIELNDPADDPADDWKKA